MDRLYAAVSMIREDKSWSPVQGAGLFVVGSSVNPGMPFSMDCFQTDAGKVPPNLWYL